MPDSDHYLADGLANDLPEFFEITFVFLLLLTNTGHYGNDPKAVTGGQSFFNAAVAVAQLLFTAKLVG